MDLMMSTRRGKASMTLELKDKSEKLSEEEEERILSRGNSR
jgi:hypothetical protein